jgi:hypothetical protein
MNGCAPRLNLPSPREEAVRAHASGFAPLTALGDWRGRVTANADDLSEPIEIHGYSSGAYRETPVNLP